MSMVRIGKENITLPLLAYSLNIQLGICPKINYKMKTNVKII